MTLISYNTAIMALNLSDLNEPSHDRLIECIRTYCHFSFFKIYVKCNFII